MAATVDHEIRPGADADRQSISAELAGLEALMHHLEQVHGEEIAGVHVDHVQDAVNLVHYLALRHEDVRHLQRRLGERGLSRWVGASPMSWPPSRAPARCARREAAPPGPGHAELRGGKKGPGPQYRRPLRPATSGAGSPVSMVTLPTAAADDYALIRHLVARGMDVARINGAHDDPQRWERMAGNVRQGFSPRSIVTARCRWTCRGPRCGPAPCSTGARVVKLQPQRDLRGVAIAPAFATLVPEFVSDHPSRTLPVDAVVDRATVTRETWSMSSTPAAAPRELRVVEATPTRLVVEVWDTTYMETGTTLACAGDATGWACWPSPPMPRAGRRGPRRAHDRCGAGRAVASRPARRGPNRLHPPRRPGGGQDRPPRDPRRREDDRCDRISSRGGRAGPDPHRVASGICAFGRRRASTCPTPISPWRP